MDVDIYCYDTVSLAPQDGFPVLFSIQSHRWVSCVLSDGFPVLFSIQSHRLGFLCAQWWVSCTLLHPESHVRFPVCSVIGFLDILHPESQVGFPLCSVMGFLYSSPSRVTGLVSSVLSNGFPVLFSIQSHMLGFLEDSPSRVTGWVSCVLSDGFPVLFSIQCHMLGFMCAQ